MKVSEVIKDIINTNDYYKFIRLVDHLRYEKGKSTEEVRDIFTSCGMTSAKFDYFKKISGYLEL